MKPFPFCRKTETNSGNETHYLAPAQEVGFEDVPDSSVAGKDATSSGDNLRAGDTLEVWADAPDDMLHMVCIYII